jgi:hypothetical protein
MAAADALTFVFMLLCIVFAVVMAIFKLPELSAIFLIGVYYFSIFHIAQVVGDDKGWHRRVLSTYLWVLFLTIFSFAITYYRYGLVSNGALIEIRFIDAIYFSVTTWTTLGYGDFVPPERLRHITSIQAILGYIGLGLWITLISGFIQNMALNRQRIRKHNEQLFRKLKEKEQQEQKEHQSN